MNNLKPIINEFSGYKKFKKEIDMQVKQTDILKGTVFFDKLNKLFLGFSYIGENILTEMNEGYIILFLDNNYDISDLKYNILDEINKRVKDFIFEKVDLYYLQIFNESNLVLKNLIEKDDSPFQHLNLLSSGMYKKLNYLNNQGNITKKESGLVIRRIKSENDHQVESVINCLQIAYTSGVRQSLGSDFDIKLLNQKVTELFLPLTNENRICLIAEKDGKFCGHALYEVSNVHSMEKYARLIDIFILPAFLNQGISQKLAYEGESICYNLGVKEITATVENEDYKKLVNLLINLKKDGWKRLSVTFTKKIFH